MGMAEPTDTHAPKGAVPTAQQVAAANADLKDGAIMLTDESARALAQRWAAHNCGDEWRRRDEDGRILPPARWTTEGWEEIEPLDAYEREALLGWVRRRMAREVEVRAKRCDLRAIETPAALSSAMMHEGDGLPANDCETLAHAVMRDLGEPFTSDPSGEHGLAWTLCELAGWPS
jgi:hypothetical protein